MKRVLLIFTFLLVAQLSVLAMVSTSTNYKVIGEVRAMQTSVISGANFIVGSGFFKTAYFGIPKVLLAPIITSISPSNGLNSGSINIFNLSGANFLAGATVKLSKVGQADIEATNVSVASSSLITCTFDLTGKAIGLWDITVINPDGKSGNLPLSFTVGFPAPIVNSITPGRGFNDGRVDITNLTGTFFRTGATVKLLSIGESDIIADSVVVESAGKITCQFNLMGKPTGIFDVVVTNDDNQSGTLAQGFKIESPTLKVVGDEVKSSQNPFNPAVSTTSIQYSLSQDSDITLTVFNLRGEKVWERFYPAGSLGGKIGLNQIDWDGLTDYRSYVSFGVYILMVTAKENGVTKVLAKTKIAVVK